MNLLGIFLIVLGALLAWKVAALVLRLVFLALVGLGLYLLVGPLTGVG